MVVTGYIRKLLYYCSARTALRFAGRVDTHWSTLTNGNFLFFFFPHKIPSRAAIHMHMLKQRLSPLTSVGKFEVFSVFYICRSRRYKSGWNSKSHLPLTSRHGFAPFLFSLCSKSLYNHSFKFSVSRLGFQPIPPRDPFFPRHLKQQYPGPKCVELYKSSRLGYELSAISAPTWYRFIDGWCKHSDRSQKPMCSRRKLRQSPIPERFGSECEETILPARRWQAIIESPWRYLRFGECPEFPPEAEPPERLLWFEEIGGLVQKARRLSCLESSARGREPQQMSRRGESILRDPCLL